MAKRLTQEDKDRIYNMRESGYTLDEIKEKTGRAVSSIMKVLAEKGYRYTFGKKGAISNSMREEPGSSIKLEKIVVEPAPKKIVEKLKIEKTVEPEVKPSVVKPEVAHDHLCVTTGISKMVVGTETKLRYTASETNKIRILTIENRTGRIRIDVDILKDLRDELIAVEKMAMSLKTPTELW